jgi:hypothetical protein
MGPIPNKLTIQNSVGLATNVNIKDLFLLVHFSRGTFRDFSNVELEAL